MLRVYRAVVGPVTPNAWSEHSFRRCAPTPTFLQRQSSRPGASRSLAPRVDVDAPAHVARAHRHPARAPRHPSATRLPTTPTCKPHCSDYPPNNARRSPTTTSPPASPTSPNCSATPPTPRAPRRRRRIDTAPSTPVRTKPHEHQHFDDLAPTSDSASPAARPVASQDADAADMLDVTCAPSTPRSTHPPAWRTPPPVLVPGRLRRRRPRRLLAGLRQPDRPAGVRHRAAGRRCPAINEYFAQRRTVFKVLSTCRLAEGSAATSSSICVTRLQPPESYAAVATASTSPRGTRRRPGLRP